MTDPLPDRIAIVDVAIRYAWALDTRNLDDLRQVFTPDASATLRGVECRGVEQIMARIGGSVLRLDRTQHLIANHQVTIDGNAATHRCQLHSQHVLDGCDGGDTFVVGGYYEGWRIAHRLMNQTWTEGNPNVVRREA
jgi:hypothetical protein